jgi:hypothetical protein
MMKDPGTTADRVMMELQATMEHRATTADRAMMELQATMEHRPTTAESGQPTTPNRRKSWLTPDVAAVHRPGRGSLSFCLRSAW